MLLRCEICVLKPSACCKVTHSAASVLLQLREDVTRYRYGDEQHLDESLTKIFMFNRVRNTLKVTPLCIAFIMSHEEHYHEQDKKEKQQHSSTVDMMIHVVVPLRQPCYVCSRNASRKPHILLHCRC